VIPTRNSGRTIEACVRTAAAQAGDVEVVVVDNHSDDGTAVLAERAGADRVLTGGPERCAQRNLGWRISGGELVVFVDSDMVLRPGLADDVRSAFTARADVGALVIPEHAFGEGYLARCRTLEKRAYLGDPRAEAARAFRATVLDQVGGYDESINAFEDYELADRIERFGWATGRTEVALDHDEGRVNLRSLYRKKRYYGTTLHTVRGRDFDWSRRGGRDWRAVLRAMASDPVHAPGLLLLKAVDASGLLVGHVVTRRS
jgi:glycosyltransferase involved in cell wall biosynthesis